MGTLRVDWVHPFPHTPYTAEFKAYYAQFEQFLRERVDSVRIDAEGKYPPEVIAELKRMGAFGLKIPKKYGGCGFTQAEYGEICALLAAWDGSLAALVSAHNSIGVPQPVYLFGTEEQKQEFLTRCAAGAISAFALTEPDVGSDPARLATTATRQADGSYRITGEKLWITNGTIAELMVVMARDAETNKISAFVVEMDSPGIEVVYRCRFMGLKALENGQIRFTDVAVPAKNRIGADGQGLKIALVTLNTGRLSLPEACLGGTRRLLGISRRYSNTRVQWGQPVGKHEAISHKLSDLATVTFAMESWANLANELSMREGYDIRLEAATAKEWASTRGWTAVDETMQIRGGRGYETEASLAGRGEVPEPVERILRDSRINRIFEGSSEIMHLFMAREMVDVHLQVSGALLDPKATPADKLKVLPKVAAFYAAWYPKLWFGLFTPFRYGEFGKLAPHLRYAERAARRLARSVFHGMVRYQAKLERKQAFLFRTVDIAMELAVLVATVSRADKLRKSGDESAVVLADVHARNARRLVEQRFHELWANDDDARTALGRAVLAGEHLGLEDAGIVAPAVAPAAEA
ncbi:MAG: acyl-CoA dehydrogenase family protein, partial [Deltaproteobacteria bacterium]|nr:acyl-CoA dehydrogenase family protein [Deltaproteobacteria bacterium]